MTKPKTPDQLQAEKEQAETQLAQEQHKLERLENRKKYLEKGERTKRTPVSYTHLTITPADATRVDRPYYCEPMRVRPNHKKHILRQGK